MVTWSREEFERPSPAVAETDGHPVNTIHGDKDSRGQGFTGTGQFPEGSWIAGWVTCPCEFPRTAIQCGPSGGVGAGLAAKPSEGRPETVDLG